uniref:Uncharacterized protein n=1 Tax=Rhodococcus sp. NS1 TaxID=402236 RepID=A0A097SQ55_9NOCA|nr:hypothetical protein LRS1606.224 [Rhodococcus sp. NS1]
MATQLLKTGTDTPPARVRPQQISTRNRKGHARTHSNRNLGFDLNSKGSASPDTSTPNFPPSVCPSSTQSTRQTALSRSPISCLYSAPQATVRRWPRPGTNQRNCQWAGASQTTASIALSGLIITTGKPAPKNV